MIKLNEKNIFVSKSTLFELSDGRVMDSKPFFFEKLDQWKQEAKAIEKRLKYTKKLPENEVKELWLNDPDVKRYRELLRLIWGYETDVFIVSEKNKCDKCNQTDGLLFVEKHCIGFDTNFYDHLYLCPVCLEHERIFWDDWNTYEIIKESENE